MSKPQPEPSREFEVQFGLPPGAILEAAPPGVHHCLGLPAQAEDALAAVGTLIGLGQQARRQERLPPQFLALKAAVENERKLWKTIQQMEKISRQILFASLPDTRRRKRLTKKFLGLN